MYNNSRSNYDNNESIASNATKALDLRGTFDISYCCNLKEEKKEEIHQYYFTAITPKGVVHGSNDTNHRISILFHKRKVLGVIVWNGDDALESEHKEFQEKATLFKGIIVLIWRYKNDPFSFEVLFVYSAGELIQTMSTQFNCFEDEKLSEILRHLFNPLVGSLVPVEMLPKLPDSRQLESKDGDENGR